MRRTGSPQLSVTRSAVRPRTRALAALTAALLVLGGGAVASTVAPEAAYAAPGDAFDPADPYVFIGQDIPTRLYTAITDASGTVSFTPEGPVANIGYNALAYNTANNYLYAISRSPAVTGFPAGSLIRIGQGGVITRVGSNTFTASLAGVFGPDNYLYILTASSTGAASQGLTRINVTTGAQVGSIINLSNPVGTSTWGGGPDFAYKDGYFWMLGYGYLVRVNPANGQTTRWPLSTVLGSQAPPSGQPAGAAWTFGNGNLGFSNNSTGDIYQIAVTNPAAANPTFRLVSINPGPPSSNNDGASSPGLPTDMEIEKTGPALFTAGESITYTITVTNNGPGNSSGWTITDQVPAGLTNITTSSDGCTVSGNTVTCVGGRTLAGASTSIDITATMPSATSTCVTNTATVTGNEQDPTPGNNSSSVTTCGTALELEKSVASIDDVNGNGITDAGDEITYEFVVTNTGAVPMGEIEIADPLIGDITCPTGPLAPGASVTCTADGAYVVTASDVTAGDVTNTATASGLPDGGTTRITSDPSTVTTPTEAPSPAISLIKSADPADEDSFEVGQVITYTFVATNEGNVPLEDVTIDDSQFDGAGTLSPLSCTPSDGTLAVGAQMVCTATYELVLADIDAGGVRNTAVATATPVGGGTPIDSPPSTVEIPVQPQAAIEVVKTATPSTASSAGDTVTYRFTVRNVGNVTLTDIAIDEGAFSGTGTAPVVTCPAGSLLPGAAVVCTAPYTLTQEDVDAGAVTNEATASGQPPTGPRIDSPPSTALVRIPPAPELTVVKTASPASATAAGAAISYEFRVTNTGNVSVENVTVNETSFSGTGTAPTVTCPSPVTLAHGEDVICTASYTLTQADVDAGAVRNTATATGDTPGGGTVTSDPSSAEVTIDEAPALIVVKSSTPTIVSTVGEIVTYTFTVENTGNVTVSGIAIDEVSFGGTGTLSDIVCAQTSLAPTETTDCTATYAVTAADLDAGRIENAAQATGQSPSGTPVSSPPSSTTVDVDQQPALSLVKSADPSSAADFEAGAQITYSFVVTNTGNVTVTDVLVYDVGFTGTGPLSGILCPASELAAIAPGAQVTCTATYTVTVDDVDNGGVTNSASASGTTPGGGTVTTPPSSVTIPAVQTPAMTLVKTATPNQIAAAGASVVYTFRVTNTGNVTLNGITIDEGTFSGTGTLPEPTCATTTLRPGQYVDCQATYVVTQADVDAGTLTNTATAEATTPGGSPLTSVPSTSTVDIPPAPGLTVEKTATPAEITEAGQTIDYSFVVTNTGNVTVADIEIDETAFTGSGGAPTVVCPQTSLAPEAEMTCTASYTVTQEDVDSGSIANTAVAGGTVPSGDPIDSPPSSVTVEIEPEPGITVVKSADLIDPADFVEGLEIDYRFVVTNTGNVTLTGVTVTEQSFTGVGPMSAIDCPAATLAPGEQMICTADYTVQLQDVDAGGVTNTATASGTPPAGGTITSTPSEARVPSDPAPAIAVEKTADVQEIRAAGDKIVYSFLVTNTGNTTLTDVVVHEGSFSGKGTLSPVMCPPIGTLIPGQQVTCTATYTVVQGDLTGAKLTNTATVSASGPGGSPIASDPSTAEIASEDKRAMAQTGGLSILAAAIAVPLLIALGVLLLVWKRRREGTVG